MKSPKKIKTTLMKSLLRRNETPVEEGPPKPKLADDDDDDKETLVVVNRRTSMVSFDFGDEDDLSDSTRQQNKDDDDSSISESEVYMNNASAYGSSFSKYDYSVAAADNLGDHESKYQLASFERSADDFAGFEGAHLATQRNIEGYNFKSTHRASIRASLHASSLCLPHVTSIGDDSLGQSLVARHHAYESLHHLHLEEEDELFTDMFASLKNIVQDKPPQLSLPPAPPMLHKPILSTLNAKQQQRKSSVVGGHFRSSIKQ